MSTRAERRRKQKIRKIRRAFYVFALFLFLVLIFSNKEVREQIFVDATIPEIILRGDERITLIIGETYIEPGYSAIDDGQDLTERVEVENTINVNMSGEYQVIYSVSDDYGNSSSKTRQVSVVDDYSFETDDINFYLRSLEHYIEEQYYDLSIGYINLDNNYTYKYNEEESYYGASTIKPVAALYVYENLTITKRIKELVEPMISVSSNESYVALADIIGIENLKSYGENMGLEDFMTDNTNKYYSDTTVDNQLIIWQKLWDYFENGENGEELKEYFDNDTYNCLEFNNSINALHKYGQWGNIFHDTGIIEADSPYIIVVLTNEGNRNYDRIIEDISEKIYGLNELVKNS